MYSIHCKLYRLFYSTVHAKNDHICGLQLDVLYGAKSLIQFKVSRLTVSMFSSQTLQYV